MKTKATLANQNKNRSSRHRSREFVLQGIYQWLLNQDEVASIDAYIHQAHGFEKADEVHFKMLLNGIINEAPLLREKISKVLDRPILELSQIEHVVLLIGAYELKNHPEIPYRVIINEAVELAKSFGGSDGYKYVNGVLDKLVFDLRSIEVKSAQNKSLE